MSAVVSGTKLANAIRWLLVPSGVLALAGLGGVALKDMNWRSIGILGYAGVLPVAALLRLRPVQRNQRPAGTL